MPPPALEDRFVAGEEGALREVYSSHGALVHTYCLRRLGDPSAAQDVTQDVFVSAWRGRNQYSPNRGALGAWLMGIAKNRLIDHQRRAARTPAPEDASEQPAEDDHGLERLGDRLLVGQLLAELPERRRRVIELVYLQDLTHEQVAEQTGIPLGTIKSDVRRGLAQIRAGMGDGDD